ncbi:MAG: hypothetical protein OXI16_03100 [Chloroflexota bacterium]|nr:hypothetical protein [Chloroflexota bacterium]
MAFLEAVAETMIGSQNMSRPAKETCHDPEKHVTDHDMFPPNTSQIVTGFCRKTRYDCEKHVLDCDRFPTNLSQSKTSPQIHEEKIHEEKEEAAAAANLSRSEHGPPDFFALLAGSLVKAGHPGIRAAQFSDLTGLLACYEKLTGSPPDERTAGYIAGRVSESRGVRNVVGFAWRITQDVLRTGEGNIEHAQAPDLRSRPPPETVREPAPDWDLLHLAHGEQVSPAGEVWASVLEILRLQVPRPAFETWLSESQGLAYSDGRFVVSAPSRFAAEMLEARLHPLIERAIRDAVGAELDIRYTVAPRGGESCPYCQAGDIQAAAS